MVFLIIGYGEIVEKGGDSEFLRRLRYLKVFSSDTTSRHALRVREILNGGVNRARDIENEIFTKQNLRRKT